MNKTRVMFFISLGMMVVFTATGCGLPALPGASTATFPPPSTSTTAPQPSPAALQHAAQPSAGVTVIANAHDNDESATGAAERTVRGGDEFRINRFERPFTASMDYLPQIDIVGMSMSKDDTWYYVQIKLAGVSPTSGDLDGTYGVEFDLNIDGKTEVMVLGKGPFTSDWTTNGVTAYVDKNGDIGGASSKPDDIYSGNGYETIIFDSGKGDDTDFAWARANKDNAVVEFAFKQQALKDYKTWMWDVLASATPLDPSKFYFNDTFTPERAGSPTKGDPNYPLKELAGFDNTCRVPAGFEAKGDEPMGCAVKVQKDLDFSGYPK